jgi:signal transduction histidine kinase
VWTAGSGVLGWYRGETFTAVANAPAAADGDITAIAEQPAGHLWLGTSRGNLFEFSDGRLTRSAVALGVAEATIHAVLPEADSGALWLATTEGLVLVLDGTVRRFTQADGLPDDIVLQLLADDRRNLWLGSPRGLFRIARAELLERAKAGGAAVNPIAYGPEQGLAGISPATNYQPSAVKDRRGTLWFCTYRGAIGIHPDRLPRDAPPPPVWIDEVRLDERPIAAPELARVPPGAHQLAFRFAALSFAAPERVRVRHQLEGFDADWVDTAPDRTARYAKLPPGDYRLRVIACNSEGGWNREGATLAFSVLPAWWQTPWFAVSAVIAFGALVAWGARVWSQRKLRARLERLEREHALEKERARISRDMHDELGGSVTGINLLVQRLRADRTPALNGALDLLDRRVRRLTLELERVVWTVSPKNSSLDQLAAFIERFAQNLLADSAVRCRVQGREDIPARPLNPECQHHVLAVTKEAINNVLKHSRATEAVITMSFADDAFALAVRDNGVGFTPEAQEHSERNGLRNMRTRVTELGGTLEIRSAPGRGTEVALRVPIGSAAKI